MFFRKKITVEPERTNLDITLDRYNTISIYLLWWIFIFNMYLIFWVIQTINWNAIWLFSLSIIILRFFIYKRLVKKVKNKSVLIWLKDYFLYLWKQLLLLIIIITWFSIYHNNINPATLNIYTLSNGEKQVVFFEMVHIWGTEYYNKINQNIVKLSDEWYILYFEWIDLDVDEEVLKDKIGIVPTIETYSNLSKALWAHVDVQDTYKMLKNAKLAKNTDVKFSELLTDEELTLSQSNTWTFDTSYLEKSEDKLWSSDSINDMFNNSILTKETVGSQILKFYTRWFFNFSLKHPEGLLKLQSYLIPEQSAFFTDKVIVKRNKKLSYNVINSKDKKIMITYWQQHFKWFLENLQLDNDKWEITNLQKLTVFEK